jgi:hypothetical protein
MLTLEVNLAVREKGSWVVREHIVCWATGGGVVRHECGRVEEGGRG